VDPKAVEFIHQSSYVFAGNNPIVGYELNGEETIKMVDPLGDIEASLPPVLDKPSENPNKLVFISADDKGNFEIGINIDSLARELKTLAWEVENFLAFYSANKPNSDQPDSDIEEKSFYGEKVEWKKGKPYTTNVEIAKLRISAFANGSSMGKSMTKADAIFSLIDLAAPFIKSDVSKLKDRISREITSLTMTANAVTTLSDTGFFPESLRKNSFFLASVVQNAFDSKTVPEFITGDLSGENYSNLVAFYGNLIRENKNNVGVLKTLINLNDNAVNVSNLYFFRFDNSSFSGLKMNVNLPLTIPINVDNENERKVMSMMPSIGIHFNPRNRFIIR